MVNGNIKTIFGLFLITKSLQWRFFFFWHPYYGSTKIQSKYLLLTTKARRRGSSRSSNEPPLEVNNGGLKAQAVDFQLLANSGGMENKLWVLQRLNYPARRR